jgi:predicted porin
VKGTKKIVLAISTIISASLAVDAFAVSSSPRGIYFDGDAGVTRAYGKTYPANTTNDTSGKGWSAMAGYKFTPWVAVESGYTRYASTRIKSNGITAGKDNHYAVDVTSKLILPFSNSGFEAFAKLGLGWIHSQIGSIHQPTPPVAFNTGTKTSVGLYWGGGVQYYFNNNMSAHLQYAQIQGNNNTGTLGVATAGLSILIDQTS